MKWLGILASLVLILLLCVGLLLTYWFPSNLVREELEVRLSEMLDGSVRIQTLSFNLLSGLSLEQVEFQQGTQPLIELDRLNLDYSLFGLLQRKLTINEVRIEGADLSLNLAELESGSTTPEPEPIPAPSEPTSLPPIPLTLNLDSLVISRSNIEIEVSPDIAVRLRDLNLGISGGVDKDAVQLEGDLAIVQVTVDLEEKQLRLPLGLNFDIKADLGSQHLELGHVILTSKPALGLKLSGNIENFLGSPLVELSLDETQVDLERTLALVSDFLPPEFRDVKVLGTLSPSVSVKGGLEESGFSGEVSSRIVFQKIQTDLAQFETNLHSTNLEVTLTDVAIKENKPDAGSILISLESEKAAFQEYSVEELDFRLSGDYFALGPVSAKMNLSGTANLPPQEPLDALTLPFGIQLDALGNYRTQDATIKQLVVKLGNLLNVQVEGSVIPNQQPPQTIAVDLKTRIDPYLENILPLVPHSLLEDLSIKKLPAHDFIMINAQGQLDANFRPLDVDTSARVNVSSFSIKQETLSAEGNLANMNFSLTTQYNARKGEMRGGLTGTMNLGGVAYQNMATVGQIDLALDTSYSGRVSPDFELSQLFSKQSVNLLVKNIQYAAPDLGVALEDVTLSAKLHEDLDAQHFTVDDLRMTSESLMDVQLAADFQQASKDFDVSLEIPYINIGELQGKLSGQGTQSLNELNPRGEISFSMKASGRVPEEKNIKELDIPVTLATRLTLNNVHGAFADYQVNGAEGSVSFSFAPGKRPVVRVETDLTFSELLLGEGLPLERLSGTFAKFNIVTKNFDEVEVNTFQVGMNGADVSLKGKVGGIREIIEDSTNLMANLPDLFAQLKTEARVSLGEFSQVLEPRGLSGVGQAQVGLSLLKRERGPLAFRLTLGSQGIQLNQNGTRIDNVDGQINLRKRLDWIDSASAKTQARRFRPSDILSQLRSIKGKEKSLTIGRLDLGMISASNFSANILFDQDAFKVQNLAMNLLNGGLGGNLILTGGKAFGVAGRFEAAHLDLNQLLDDKLKISGDSLVDATISLSVFFEEETGVLDLSRTDMRLFITHIGREAVDRLLVYLDPEGSNPTLVSARSQIKLANPSTVSLQLVRGMLSLEIQFSEGVLAPFTLNRIPIGKMKQFKAVTEGIPDWENVREVMELVGAQAYGLDDQGKLVLQ